MSKVEALRILKLLSAMESWALSQQTSPPDYLIEDANVAMKMLEQIILEKNG